MSHESSSKSASALASRRSTISAPVDETPAATTQAAPGPVSASTSAPAPTWEDVERLKQHILNLQRVCGLGLLAGSICHELNNLLTPILNYAKLGLRNPDPEYRNKAFEKILDASKQASLVTRGVLGLAKPRPNERTSADLAQLVEEVLRLTSKDLVSHRVQLDFQIVHRPKAKVNPAQIQQVLLNLVINARQAMPEGGRLTVRVTQDAAGKTGEISVADTGTGIAPADLRRIFEPFFSTKKGPDETGVGGSGLGLSVCREIIEAHQGRIRAQSKVGVGTTFTLRLPLAPKNEV